jgi:cytochrome d ubiquinol oxidase subunit II
MSLENQVAIWMLAGLTIYAILGSADFGGGIWSLLARGPRAAETRKSISHAMGPVWEANHTWLVFFFIVMLSAFPLAFRALSIAMYVPFHLVLAGIVLRGTAFVFHNQRAMRGTAATVWANIFGVASIITPLGMGAALAAVTTGNILVQGTSVTAQPSATWLSPFAVSIGILAVVTCAFLAAVFMTMETTAIYKMTFAAELSGLAAC